MSWAPEGLASPHCCPSLGLAGRGHTQPLQPVALLSRHMCLLSCLCPHFCYYHHTTVTEGCHSRSLPLWLCTACSATSLMSCRYLQWTFLSWVLIFPTQWSFPLTTYLSGHDLSGSGFSAVLDVTFSSAPLASLPECIFEL